MRNRERPSEFVQRVSETYAGWAIMHGAVRSSLCVTEHLVECGLLDGLSIEQRELLAAQLELIERHVYANALDEVLAQRKAEADRAQP